MAFPEFRGGQSGFILAVVLWLLLAIAVGVSLLMLWTRERLGEALLARGELEDEIAAISTRDTLLFLAATVPATQGGLPLAPIPPAELAMRRLDEFGGFDRSPRGGELRLDGSPYRGFGDVRFALQDEAGLIPIGFPGTSSLPALLAAAGVPAEQRNLLIDRLDDYVDADDLRRFHGAEANDYVDAGRGLPPNRRLVSPRELRRVLGWDELTPQVHTRLEEWSTSAYAGALNLNTAPEDLLVRILSDCGPVCRERLSRRGDTPVLTGAQFEEQAAVRLPGDRDVDFRTAPSPALRLTFWGASGRAWRIHVRLTPLADGGAPWTVDAAYRTARPDSDDVERPIQSPLFADPLLAGR